jgi:hypothetical protein
VTVELLVVKDCPNEGAAAVVRRALDEAGLSTVRITVRVDRRGTQACPQLADATVSTMPVTSSSGAYLPHSPESRYVKRQ